MNPNQLRRLTDIVKSDVEKQQLIGEANIEIKILQSIATCMNHIVNAALKGEYSIRVTFDDSVIKRGVIERMQNYLARSDGNAIVFSWSQK